jgi:hypothetical protein
MSPLKSLRAVCLLICAGLAFRGIGTPGTSAEDATARKPAIAESSDLSSALPPGEWVRVERSVDAGLEWLASQQAEDGSFPSNPVGQPAVTSLAVMAFLSRGHLPGEGRYGRQLDRAIDYVLDQQSRRGYFSHLQVAPPTGHLKPSQTLVYNHCIAGLMLGEVYGMTSGERSRRIEEALARALVFSRSVQTRQKQHPDEAGGWRYAYPDSPAANSDLSVTGWALMFYRSARNAEFEVPKQYFDEGLDFVERCFVANPAEREDGIFRYRPLTVQQDARPSLANSGSAVLTLILGGRHESQMVRAGIDWFLARDYPSPQKTAYFYLATYYSSQAMAQVGGTVWNRLYPQIVERVVAEQNPNGSWPAGRGSEVNFGPCYSTSLAVLALTPPYQLLPIYQR